MSPCNNTQKYSSTSPQMSGRELLTIRQRGKEGGGVKSNGEMTTTNQLHCSAKLDTFIYFIYMLYYFPNNFEELAPSIYDKYITIIIFISSLHIDRYLIFYLLDSQLRYLCIGKLTRRKIRTHTIQNKFGMQQTQSTWKRAYSIDNTCIYMYMVREASKERTTWSAERRGYVPVHNTLY